MNRHQQQQQKTEPNSAYYFMKNSKTTETMIRRKANLFGTSTISNSKSMSYNSGWHKHYDFKIGSNFNSIGNNNNNNKHILFKNCELKYDNYENKKNENERKFEKDYDEDDYDSEYNANEELNFEQFELLISGHKIEIPKVIFHFVKL